MKDLVFVSVAFGSAYIEQQDRLKKSILKIYPDANIMFWRGELPPNSKSMSDSLYGFKVHAITEAKKNYKKVLWLDPAMILMAPIESILHYGLIAVKDDNLLCNYISEQCVNHYSLTKEEVKENGWHLVGGSLYYFNFDTIYARTVFAKWYEMEYIGLFGSQREAAAELINSHRNDESCMALAMYSTGVFPMNADEVGYCIENNPLFIKKHFK